MKQTEAEALTLKAVVAAYASDASGTRAMVDELRLDGSDFTGPAHQALFAAIASAMTEGRPVDLLEVSRAAAKHCTWATAVDVVMGADAYAVPGLASSRIAALKDLSRRRRLSETLRSLQGLLASETSTDAVLGEVERVLRSVDGDGGRGATSLDGSLMALVDKLEAVQSGRRESTLLTDIEILDYAIGGLQPTLTMVGALPGVGKSALLSSIARNLAARGLKVGVMSLEDEREWLAERILAEAASVPLFVLGNRPLTSVQMQRIDEKAQGVHALLQHILVDDSLAMGPREIVASARNMVARGCRAVIVDHLGEIRLNRSERHDLDVQEALQDLRGIAKTYRVPVVVACHLRRREGLEKHSVPRLTDFAFSASIERCARVALGLFQPKCEAGEAPSLGVEVMKQTKGPKDFNFKLNIGALYGTVQQTPVAKAMREAFGAWRDE